MMGNPRSLYVCFSPNVCVAFLLIWAITSSVILFYSAHDPHNGPAPLRVRDALSGPLGPLHHRDATPRPPHPLPRRDDIPRPRDSLHHRDIAAIPPHPLHHKHGTAIPPHLNGQPAHQGQGEDLRHRNEAAVKLLRTTWPHPSSLFLPNVSIVSRLFDISDAGLLFKLFLLLDNINKLLVMGSPVIGALDLHIEKVTGFIASMVTSL